MARTNKISNWSIDRNGLRCNHYDSIKFANYIKHAIQANTANTSVIEKGSRGKMVPKIRLLDHKDRLCAGENREASDSRTYSRKFLVHSFKGNFEGGDFSFGLGIPPKFG